MTSVLLFVVLDTFMKKKAVHKKPLLKKQQTISPFQIIIVISLVLAILVSGKIASGVTKTHVLGASTVLLADKGSDDSGNLDGSTSGSGAGSDSNGSGLNSGSGSSASGSNSSEGPGAITLSGATAGTTVSVDTKVDCVGPDGRHFTTDFKGCQELNLHWGHTNFSFTPLSTSNIENETNNKVEIQPTVENKGILEVEKEGSKAKIGLQTKGLHVELKTEDNGQLTIKAKQENGTEVTLQDNSLNAINETLKNRGVEVGTASAGELAIKSHGVEAHTSFPLSIDPTTDTLTVTTPAGTKEVTVLPNQAVQGLLNSHILSHVLSQTSGATSSATTVVALSAVNGQPVFEIQGVKEKHLLGIFPVAFQKTVTVSAQTDQVLSTQENLINQILESLSI